MDERTTRFTKSAKWHDSWKDKRYKIVCLADDAFPIWGQSWLLTADPLMGVFVIFAKLA